MCSCSAGGGSELDQRAAERAAAHQKRMRVSPSLTEDLLSVNLLSLQSAAHSKFSATSNSDVFRCFSHAAVSSRCLYLCCITYTLCLTLCCHQSPSPYLMLQDTQYLLTRQSLSSNRLHPPTSLFATDSRSRGSMTTAGRSQRAKQQCDGNTSVDRASDCFDKEVRESTSFFSQFKHPCAHSVYWRKHLFLLLV